MVDEVRIIRWCDLCPTTRGAHRDEARHRFLMVISNDRPNAKLRVIDACDACAPPIQSMADLVKTTIFYSNVDDFSLLNAVYARYMPDPPPARSAPANVTLPRGLLVSIDAIALLP